MHRRLSIFPLALVLLFTAACSRKSSPVEDGIHTQTLLVGNGAEPDSLDPQMAVSLAGQTIANALFEGLTVLDEQTTRPLPGAAESWTHSPDGLTWTFHLRPGQLWSNGDPLVADDFIQSWRRALDPALAAPNAWYLFILKNAEAFNAGRLKDPAQLGMAAPDPHTLVLTLAHPAPYLPALVSLPAWFPLNPRVLARLGALHHRNARWTLPGNLVGNGAFTLAAWQPNARIVLDANPRYHDAANNHLRHLVFLPVEDAGVEERMFRAGQLHVTFGLPVTKIAPWRAKHPEELRIDPILQSNFLRFNTTRSPLNDPRVRRALSLALNRALLSDTVLQSSRQPAHTLSPPHLGDYDPPPGVTEDYAAARQLLAEAGYRGGVGLRPLNILCRNNDLMPGVAEAVQAIWQRELGVATTITQMEQKTWIQNQQALDYDIALSSWTADFPDPITFLDLFTADNPYNWTGWRQPDYDKLLQLAARMVDPAARYARLRQAETLLLQDAPIAPLFFGAKTYLLSPAVKGWTPAPLVFRRFQLISLQP